MALRRDIELLDVEIVTDRLVLRPISLIDLEPIAREFSEEITRYMYPPPAQSRMDVAPFIADSLEGLSNNTNLQMVAVSKEDPGSFVGCVGLHKPLTSTPEIGIWIAKSFHRRGLGLEAIAKSFHRRGLGLEAIEGLCEWAAEQIECDYLRYPVDRANAHSRRISKSLGGEIEDEYDRITSDGRTLNILEYRNYPETI
ncbi:MAG: GNAT family N-acetyltransferase [Chloroflexi bacterium]|nr:GNAT family N-acetyltransferase [Chloroflexota bacterium]